MWGVSSGKARRLYSYLLWCHSELYNLLPQPAEHWRKLQHGCLVGAAGEPCKPTVLHVIIFYHKLKKKHHNQLVLFTLIATLTYGPKLLCHVQCSDIPSFSPTHWLWVGSLHRGGTRGISLVENILYPRIQNHTGSVLFNCGNRGNKKCHSLWPSIGFKNYSSDLLVSLTSTGQMLYLPGRHIPIDTSLCSQSPQVRIYGFVAAGINTLKGR